MRIARQPPSVCLSQIGQASIICPRVLPRGRSVLWIHGLGGGGGREGGAGLIVVGAGRRPADHKIRLPRVTRCGWGDCGLFLKSASVGTIEMLEMPRSEDWYFGIIRGLALPSRIVLLTVSCPAANESETTP